MHFFKLQFAQKNKTQYSFQTNYTLLPSVGLYGSTESLEVIDNA